MQDTTFTITVVRQTQTDRVPCESGQTLLSALASAGVFIAAPCGGRGRCGKCRVQILDGTVSGDVPDAEGCVRACLATPTSHVTLRPLTADADVKVGQAVTHTFTGGAGIALDIGTTTLAAALIDLNSGETVDSYGMLNPQGVLGADVISRITAARAGKTDILHKLILGATGTIVRTFSARYGLPEITRMTVAGNTTMLHLFAGEDPSGMGEVPFTPVFLGARVYKGAQLGLPIATVELLPSISSFVGADITAGIYSEKVAEGQTATLLVDIGTNGEMALHSGGKLYVCSTAAGPALEGADISCGKGGIAGAVDHVWTDEAGAVRHSVIGGGKADGICGSGLIDAMAVLLQRGILDETGLLGDDWEDGFAVAEGVTLVQKDIRAFQLAKSAIAAGVKTLAAAAETPLEAIDRVLVAGGMGYYLNAESAVAVGLLPREFAGKIKAVGNSALAGAVLCLTNSGAMEQFKRLAGSAIGVDLSANPLFMELFVENMGFETR